MNPSAVEEEILHQAITRASALVHRDAAALETLLSIDFVYTNSSGTVFSRQGYIEAYVLDRSVVWRAQHLKPEHIKIVGDTAILVGRVHDEARFGELEVDADFATTQVYRRSNRRWQYLAGHTSLL